MVLLKTQYLYIHNSTLNYSACVAYIVGRDNLPWVNLGKVSPSYIIRGN